ncbi:replication initiation protein [Hymenobacter sp. NBH84]|uniref:replication initiation protein n=1 Tax=Hymenobacter sp. NBH84 TaxID=2596915 RepID=UPI001623FB92|nr:replication initiation protein [Hymenobacter sp. NBH84]
MNTIACLSNQLVRQPGTPMTLAETKIFISALRRIHKRNALPEISIPVSEVLPVASGAGYKMVREALERLNSRLYDGQPLFLDLRIEDGTATIQGQFNNQMQQHLKPTGECSCINFTRIQFKNAHSYRLLWLLDSWNSIKVEIIQPLEELRQFFFADTSTYAVFANLKRHFLDVIEADFKAAGLTFSYRVKKKGRSVVAIIWKTLEAPKAIPTEEIQEKEAIWVDWLERQPPILNDCYSWLLKYKLTKPEAWDIIKMVCKDANKANKLQETLYKVSVYKAGNAIKDLRKLTLTYVRNSFKD